MIEKPILLDLPMPIRTPRLVITMPLPEHSDAVREAKIESMPELTNWMLWAASNPRIGEEKTILTEALAEFILRENLMMLVFTHEGEFVAATGLHRFNWKVPRCEIGYWCRSSMTGKGYITEMANALTRYAFEVMKMRKVTIDVDSENTKSAAVAKRLEFVHDYDDLGGIVIPNATELRTRSVYACYDPTTLPPLEVNW